MNLQGQRDLILLTELERDGAVTQRSLATKLGVALGLTNLYLKRLARKGYVKVTTIPSHRIRYLLTPQGFAEKSRLTYLYMQYSLTHYREMRARLREVLSRMTEEGGTRVVIFGTNELAELAYLSLREMDLVLVGFFDDGKVETFLSHPVSTPEALKGWEFDAVLLADLNRLREHREILRTYQASFLSTPHRYPPGSPSLCAVAPSGSCSAIACRRKMSPPARARVVPFPEIGKPVF